MLFIVLVFLSFFSIVCMKVLYDIHKENYIKYRRSKTKSNIIPKIIYKDQDGNIIKPGENLDKSNMFLSDKIDFKITNS